MAGVTNQPFRILCRELAAATGDGLYVSEMVTARGLVEGGARSWRLVRFAPDERPRSAQLYGVDPATMAEAVRMLIGEAGVEHIDLNFGCPVPKVTRKGGGAALPLHHVLLGRIIAATVGAAAVDGVPVTVKFRLGVDDEHLTHLATGRIAEAEGAAAVALHARTAAQHYSGHADWTAIATLRATVSSIPVLGNGDIWTVDDAMAMRARTGCDGVVIGR
ncbi:MAG: tRNA-dihydrouridine synthase, partial [Acidimicrobiales bacterium]